MMVSICHYFPIVIGALLSASLMALKKLRITGFGWKRLTWHHKDI
jgi:hypothetical protein